MEELSVSVPRFQPLYTRALSPFQLLLKTKFFISRLELRPQRALQGFKKPAFFRLIEPINPEEAVNALLFDR